MVKEVVGYDDNGNEIFRRKAREYDKSISHTTFGITIGDIIKAIPIIVACALFYANDQNFKENQQKINSQIFTSVHEDAAAIGGIKEVLDNLNNYLSSTTGKQFEDGRPR